MLFNELFYVGHDTLLWSIFFCHKLTTEAAASLLPPYNMPANTPITVAVPQLTIPGSLGEP